MPVGPKAEKCLSFQEEKVGGREEQVAGAPKAERVGRKPGDLNSLLLHLGVPPR